MVETKVSPRAASKDDLTVECLDGSMAASLVSRSAVHWVARMDAPEEFQLAALKAVQRVSRMADTTAVQMADYWAASRAVHSEPMTVGHLVVQKAVWRALWKEQWRVDSRV